MKPSKYITTIPSQISIEDTSDDEILINFKIQYENYSHDPKTSIEITKRFLEEERPMIHKQSLINIRSKITQLLSNDLKKTQISFDTDEITSSTKDRLKSFRSFIISDMK